MNKITYLNTDPFLSSAFVEQMARLQDSFLPFVYISYKKGTELFLSSTFTTCPESCKGIIQDIVKKERDIKAYAVSMLSNTHQTPVGNIYEIDRQYLIGQTLEFLTPPYDEEPTWVNWLKNIKQAEYIDGLRNEKLHRRNIYGCNSFPIKTNDARTLHENSVLPVYELTGGGDSVQLASDDDIQEDKNYCVIKEDTKDLFYYLHHSMRGKTVEYRGYKNKLYNQKKRSENISR